MTRAGRVLVWTSGLLIAFGTASVASAQNTPRKQQRARRESNSSRQARIARTVQDTYTHRYEVFGGGGYLRWRSGEYTQKNNEVSWATSVNYALNPRLAIVADARGSFGNAKALYSIGFNQIPRPQINEYFFTGGVNYRLYAKEKFGVSVQGTGGTAWGMFSGGAKGLTGQDVGLWQDGNRPAFIFNINADYNIYPNLAVRLSPTYVGTTFGGQTESNLGLNAGVLYRFGRIGKK